MLDDPFTSQDRSRRDCTKWHVCRLAERARQVIVLSHDPYFLRLVAQGTAAGSVKTLQLARMGDDTTITEWDVDADLEGEYFADHRKLRAFRDGDATSVDRRDVARSIRPLLEGYLRFKLPGQLSLTDWLGGYIQAIRDADDISPLAAAKVALPALETLNSYTSRYHHAQNPNADSEPINDGELLAMVKRALKLVGGF